MKLILKTCYRSFFTDLNRFTGAKSAVVKLYKFYKVFKY